jgi:hypothetical protein
MTEDPGQGMSSLVITGDHMQGQGNYLQRKEDSIKRGGKAMSSST